MPKFLFIYRGSNEEKEMSPEDLQKSLEAWSAWINEGFAKGWMVDPGDALMPEGKLVKRDKIVTDGPFAESKEIVGGYTVVQTESIEKAAELSKSCPIFAGDGWVEVRPMMGLAAQEG